MSTEIAPIPQKAKTSALAVMAERLQVDPQKLLETLKATVFKNASDAELLALVVVANAYGLNPLTKEIYAFPGKSGGIVPVISIDGWANLANSHPQMDGIEFEWDHDADGKLVSCTSVIYRKDRSHPVRVTEYLSECRRNTDPWKMEHRMLRHKALSQGVRIAFGFSGVYDEDEAKDIALRTERDITPAARSTAPVPSLLRDGPTEAPKAATKRAATMPQPEPPTQDEPERPIETEPPLEEQPDAWQEEPPQEEPPQEKEKPAAAPKPAKKTDWKGHVIHFGEKTKGKTLGSLNPSVLVWFADTWLPTAKASADKTKDDVGLIAALETYKAEIQQ